MTDEMDETAYRWAAVMWAFITLRQADRLDEAVGEFNKAQLDQHFLDERAAGTLPDDWQAYLENEAGDGISWWVTWTLGAEQYFFLAAAAQLRKCVMKLPDDGLPEFTDDRMILMLRNFTEHWEDPTGWSTRAMREIVPDAAPGQLTYAKKDVWIEGVSTAGIIAWAVDVDRALRARAAKAGDELPDPHTSRPKP